MIRLDMSEFTDEDGIRRLLGAAPGEGDERGELTDKIHDNPSSLIMFFHLCSNILQESLRSLFSNSRWTQKQKRDRFF